ncbi:MAG: glycosyltransferase family 2 protein [Paludibacteraceae bacterium]|nr:glycosyltransferase family 2 protein [Paludibacteraceae bacterium]
MELTLSILVISHNQKELLRRCITSLLQQQLSFSYEIIISDDRSTDGTWELIEAYQQQYPDLIFGYHCNSDECNPANLSERCGWNKANAYRHAKGKYFVNIDADDYLLSDDIYQKQIDLLEGHPECSLCMQKVWVLREGAPVATGHGWPSAEGLTTGSILTPSDIILRGLRGLNQSYMIRRNPRVDVARLYGKHFDDTIITLHHLQFGNVIFLDRADYVWVQYGKSINSSLKNIDREVVIGLLPIHHILFVPQFAGLFMKDGIRDLINLWKVCPQASQLSEDTLNFIKQFDGFIFRYFSTNQHSIVDQVRFFLVRTLSLFINKFNLIYLYRFLYVLIVSKVAVKNRTNFQWRII